MLTVEVLTGGAVPAVVAVIEFTGERQELIPGGEGAAKIYNPVSREQKGYRFRHGSLPDDVVQRIYQGVCDSKVTDSVGEYTWRRA